MSQKVAILDVDGVLLDVSPGLVQYVKDRYNYEIKEEHITDYDWDYCLGLEWGVPEEIWDAVWGTPATPYPGAIEFILDLKKKGYWVQGLSKRVKKNSVKAAVRDFEQLPLDDYVLEKRKTDWILTNFPNARFMVEDYPKTAGYVGENTNLNVYLLTKPWNDRCITVTNAWERVYSYEDIISKV